jgi:hypothetical protein
VYDVRLDLHVLALAALLDHDTVLTRAYRRAPSSIAREASLTLPGPALAACDAGPSALYSLAYATPPATAASPVRRARHFDPQYAPNLPRNRDPITHRTCREASPIKKSSR